MPKTPIKENPLHQEEDTLEQSHKNQQPWGRGGGGGFGSHTQSGKK